MLLKFADDTELIKEMALGDNVFESLVKERDLGLLIINKVKFYLKKQCCKAVNDANRLLDIKKRNFIFRSTGFMTALYTSLIWPKLD